MDRSPFGIICTIFAAGMVIAGTALLAFSVLPNIVLPLFAGSIAWSLLPRAL